MPHIPPALERKDSLNHHVLRAKYLTFVEGIISGTHNSLMNGVKQFLEPPTLTETKNHGKATVLGHFLGLRSKVSDTPMSDVSDSQ